MRHEKLFWWTPLIIAVLSFILTLGVGNSKPFWADVGEHILFLPHAYIIFMLIYIMHSNARAKKARGTYSG